MTRTLVVLGGGGDQLFMVRTARQMGLATLVFDMNPKAAAFAEADHHAIISTREPEAICAYLDRPEIRALNLAGVSTMGSDIPDIVAHIAHHLGTPAISMESARLATDKFAMKRRFRECNVPIPWFAEVETAAEVRRALAERGRVVIKPVDRSGSRGVFLLGPDSDVEALFQTARDFSFSGRVQVEEYLPGLQISTETIMVNGRAVTPGFADRNYELLERFLPQIMENGGWVPSILGADDRAAVERAVEQASLALGITDGVTKGDVVLTPEGPKIIEIAARLSGGDFCESLVPLGTGINYVRAVIAMAVGDQPDLDALEPQWNVAVANRYFFPPPGRLVRVEGAEEVAAQDWVKKLEFWYQPGDVVPEMLSHAHRFGVFVLVAPDRATAQQRVDWVYRTINIVVE